MHSRIICKSNFFFSHLVLAVQALEDAQISPADVHTVEVVGGSSRVPALLRIIKDFFGKEPGRTLNAKECVSRGAALNCAMLSPIFRSAIVLLIASVILLQHFCMICKHQAITVLNNIIV